MVPELNCVYLRLLKGKIRIKIQNVDPVSRFTHPPNEGYITHTILSIKSHEIVCLNRRLNKVYTGLKCIISQFNRYSNTCQENHSNTCQENHSHFQVRGFTNIDVCFCIEHTCKVNVVKYHKLGCLVNKYKWILEDNPFCGTPTIPKVDYDH